MRKRPLKERLFDGFFYGTCLFVIMFSLLVLGYFYFSLQYFAGYPILLYSLLIIIGISGLRLYYKRK